MSMYVCMYVYRDRAREYDHKSAGAALRHKKV